MFGNFEQYDFFVVGQSLIIAYRKPHGHSKQKVGSCVSLLDMVLDGASTLQHDILANDEVDADVLCVVVC